MRVLVTGGTGLVGSATVDALLERGHQVRLVSRHARKDGERWPGRVEPFEADLADSGALTGAADGCDVALHAVGIVREAPPAATFDLVNVVGTRQVAAEAARAGVHRFVFVSSLGAERGRSAYHRSKRSAEEVVRQFPGAWVIARVGNVFGPGDEVLSSLLTMVRTLPVVPLIGAGDQPFQPIWHRDAGQALAALAERADLDGRVLEIAGAETTTMDDVLERFAVITGRNPPRIPIPSLVAELGAQMATAAGVELPVTEDHIRMLVEHNVVRAPEGNALTLLGVQPTHLDTALRLLADALPEQLPSDGVGPVRRKRFWARILGSDCSAEELCGRFCDRFGDLAPAETGVEPGTPTRLAEGATLTMRLPLRGTFQVRCEEVTGRRVTLATIDGHPLAGVVRFFFDPQRSGIMFEVEVVASAATYADMVALAGGGAAAQSSAWTAVVENVVGLSGGTAPDGVHDSEEELDEDEAHEIEDELESLIRRRRRAERAG